MHHLGKHSSVTIHQRQNSSRNNLHFLRAMASSTTRSVTEVQVPTPWGHLATKCWNLPSADNPRDFTLSTHLPVVCVHGWQDNAGTFDTLIPLLDKDIPFICLDFAGHGKSSHRPFAANELAMYAFDVKRVIDYFRLDGSGLNLMGHSLGGAISIIIAGTFPEIIRKCLTFDSLSLTMRKAFEAPKYLAAGIKKVIEFEESEKPVPMYSHKESVQRFLKGRNYQMTENSAQVLLKRGLKIVDQSDDGELLYQFSRDFKVTLPQMMTLGPEQFMAFFQNVSCHHRIFTFKDSEWLALEAEDKEWQQKMMEIRKKISEVNQKNCQSFKWIEKNGMHHAHLDNPEKIAAEVNTFLMVGDSEL